MPVNSSNVLDQASELLKRRIKELDDEKARLERALSDLTGGRIGRRGPGRPRGSKSAGGRRRGTRAAQALKLVKDNPGITAGEIAKRMGIAPNYVYRVMGELQKDDAVKKRGRKYTAK